MFAEWIGFSDHFQAATSEDTAIAVGGCGDITCDRTFRRFGDLPRGVSNATRIGQQPRE
jgi:hypothetical protein